jgi:hypothetical protein
MNEADSEYGPTPADAAYEHTDIEPSIAGRFAVWLTIAMVISAGIVYGTFWFFEGLAQTSSQASQQFPLAAAQVREPEGPKLQTQPFKDVYLLRQGENEKLTSYGWVRAAASSTFQWTRRCAFWPSAARSPRRRERRPD